MAVVTLGLSGAMGYDPACALFIDGELIVAVEEERLVRRKHARDMLPIESIRYCLRAAKLKPRQVDQVAIACAPVSLFSRARWHYARRNWYAPDQALSAIFNGNRRFRRYHRQIRQMLSDLGIPVEKIRLQPVEHQLAHAASAYYMSGFKEKTAIFCIDQKGEYATTLLGYGENGKIHKVREFYEPDSLAGMYASMCDYLGFDKLDGETKVMGIATFGDPEKYDLSFLTRYRGKDFRVNTRMLRVSGLRRYKRHRIAHSFSQDLLDALGPRRAGDVFQDPYVHYAASIQRLYENTATGLVTHYLRDVLKESGKLVIAGSGAFNVKLNQRLSELPWVNDVYVPPAAGDAGTAIGSAAWMIANINEQEIKPLHHAALGPKFTTERCIKACEQHREKPVYEVLEKPADKAAELLAAGHLVGWFQGRMEFGPRALGNRSLLANPQLPDSVSDINSRVKFREKWRCFSPSMLPGLAKRILGADAGRADFMTRTFRVSEEWQKKFPGIVYHDGTTRAHIVHKDSNSRFYSLLMAMKRRTGTGMVINTSLNRPGEALICTPEDALDMFFGSDLEYLIMQDLLITKPPEDNTGWERS
ncbi:MAG TPA: carbamoyltransferase C-terminal domain-containing protein [Pseudohongiella sp.]|nr:carbamoyltransferase C-terminal domain-containing protein [Pseudohongiella sp.]